MTNLELAARLRAVKGEIFGAAIECDYIDRNVSRPEPRTERAA